MLRAPLVVSCLVSTLALAQSRPTLVDAPLEVRVPMPKAKADALQNEFRMVLARSTEVLVPTRSNWRTATAALKRQDCDIRDECLKQLALNAQTLYALYASVERNAAGTEVTAAGRVVNQDGRLVRETQRVTVSAASKNPSLDALEQLLRKLDLASLPPVLAGEPEPTPPVVSEPVASVVLPPPPVTPAPEPAVVVTQPSAPSGGRVAGTVLIISGVVAGAVAVGCGVTGAVLRGGLPADGRLVSDAQANTQQQVNGLASGSLGVGLGAGALLLSGIIVTATSSSVAVSAAPTQGGGTVVLTGRF